MSTLAFHFVRLNSGVPTLRDGRPMPAVGEWLEEAGPIEICARGLHASVRAIDALNYLEWPDAAVCVVELDGIVDSPEHTDKIVGSRRRVLGWSPCDDLLRFFARECALSVAGNWDMPPIVREYLETGDEDKRAAAEASWAASRAARASWTASWAASRAARASWAASRAARASWTASRAARASWTASWAASRAARDSWTAARASWAASWDASWAASRDDQNAILESLIVDACGVEFDGEDSAAYEVL